MTQPNPPTRQELAVDQRILIWLGVHRDALPPDAVAAMQDIANSARAVPAGIAAAAKVDHLEHVIDRDRYIVAAVLGEVKRTINGHAWLMGEGRGPYEWDDDRYREEFGNAVENIERAIEPLAKVAWDKSDCTNIAERVDAARIAAREMLKQPIRPSVMVAADLGLPCPACNQLAAPSPPESEWARAIEAAATLCEQYREDAGGSNSYRQACSHLASHIRLLSPAAGRDGEGSK